MKSNELHGSHMRLNLSIDSSPGRSNERGREKLAAQQQLEEEYHRFVQQKPRLLTETEREAIRRLAIDIPALWAAPTTTFVDRKEIIRQVVERVIVDVQGTSERVKVRIGWIGGGHTEAIVIRPVRSLSDLSISQEICQQVKELTEVGWSAEAHAGALNEAGYRPPRANPHFRAPLVAQLQREIGIVAPRPRVRKRDSLLPNEWWPAELVHKLGLSRTSLHHWIKRGLVQARQLDEPLHRWVVWADEEEMKRLQQYHQRNVEEHFRSLWTDGHLQSNPE